MTKQRITVVSIVGLLVFGLLLGGQMIYKRNWVDADLIQNIEQIPGIESAQITKVNGINELEVKTKQVKHLKKMASELEKNAAGMPIRIIDDRSAELETVYEQMQFAIQEGITRGNFSEMADRLQEQAQQAGSDLDLTIDSNNIYLSLTAHDRQLISIIERRGQGTFIR